MLICAGADRVVDIGYGKLEATQKNAFLTDDWRPCQGSTEAAIFKFNRYRIFCKWMKTIILSKCCKLHKESPCTTWILGLWKIVFCKICKSGTVMIYLTNVDSPLTQKVTKNYIIRGPHFYNLIATFRLSKKGKKSF